MQYKSLVFLMVSAYLCASCSSEIDSLETDREEEKLEFATEQAFDGGSIDDEQNMQPEVIDEAHDSVEISCTNQGCGGELHNTRWRLDDVCNGLNEDYSLYDRQIELLGDELSDSCGGTIDLQKSQYSLVFSNSNLSLGRETLIRIHLPVLCFTQGGLFGSCEGALMDLATEHDFALSSNENIVCEGSPLTGCSCSYHTFDSGSDIDYSISENHIVLADQNYPYCVRGDALYLALNHEKWLLQRDL